MAIEIRDFTRLLRMPADSYAAVIESDGTYWFAGGRGYSAIMAGESWDSSRNTDTDWAERHPTEMEAFAAARVAASCVTGDEGFMEWLRGQLDNAD